MALLGIDIGTTRLKAGLFNRSGQTVVIVDCPNPVDYGWEAIAAYNPDLIWRRVLDLLERIGAWYRVNSAAVEPVQAVGVASMAETGLLVEAVSGAVRTPLIPWFDPIATSQAEAVKREVDLRWIFNRTGLHPAYKYSLMKLLWLKDHHPDLLEGGLWLSAADWIVYRLCGVLTTDHTLAERTCAFRIDIKEWDTELLARFGLSPAMFPGVGPSGRTAGRTPRLGLGAWLPEGTPVGVCGHDHVCGALVAAVAPGEAGPAVVFDSIGTAESLIGTFPERRLHPADYRAGFSVGLACSPGALYWQGSLSASGGSIEWLRSILGDPQLAFTELDALVGTDQLVPTGIVYFPYLAGSGSPHSDSLARGAFLGLNPRHTRADLYQAVLEGCAYEMAYQRERAVQWMDMPAGRILAAGGGTRNRRWMQIKADVYGCALEVLEQSETTLLGAAILAGIGSEVYSGYAQARDELTGLRLQQYDPDPVRTALYREVFETGFSRYESLVREVRIGLDQPAASIPLSKSRPSSGRSARRWLRRGRQPR